MADLDKKSLSEGDICTKFITPAVKQAGWDEMSQIRKEVGFTKGRMEAQLTTTQSESRRRLEAVLHQALAPAV